MTWVDLKSYFIRSTFLGDIYSSDGKSESAKGVVAEGNFLELVFCQHVVDAPCKPVHFFTNCRKYFYVCRILKRKCIYCSIVALRKLFFLKEKDFWFSYIFLFRRYFMFVGFLREHAFASNSLPVLLWATSFYICKILKRKCI